MKDLTLSQLHLFEVINHSIFQLSISAFGCCTNMANIIIFIKLGFEDTINISLLGLSISDLFCSIFMMLQGVLFIPLIRDNQEIEPFNYLELQYLTTGWPHQLFVRITSLITVFVTFERCLCVILPLKVKTILNAKTTSAVIAAIYIGSIASVSPVFYALRFQSYQNANETMIKFQLAFQENGRIIENVVFASNTAVLLFSMFGVSVCTLLLVKTLLSKSRWRQRAVAAQSDNAGNKQTRDLKVVKMVVLIAGLYIFCYFFIVVAFTLMIALDDFGVTGKYKNTFHTAWSFLNIFSALNSSVNIVIYFKMSSKFKDCFLKMIRCRNRYE